MRLCIWPQLILSWRIVIVKDSILGLVQIDFYFKRINSYKREFKQKIQTIGYRQRAH